MQSRTCRIKEKHTTLMATGRYHLAFVKFYVLDFSSFCISPPHSTFRVLLHSSTARDCAIEPALLLCSWLFVYMVYVRSFFSPRLLRCCHAHFRSHVDKMMVQKGYNINEEAISGIAAINQMNVRISSHLQC